MKNVIPVKVEWQSTPAILRDRLPIVGRNIAIDLPVPDIDINFEEIWPIKCGLYIWHENSIHLRWQIKTKEVGSLHEENTSRGLVQQGEA